ncbi:MAG: ABC transporter permease [Eubacterium sp.]|uniref:ABC transporter permease n=1 Tax=Eubacterium sp. TaxID=142586 RepID=UPI003A16E9E2
MGAVKNKKEGKSSIGSLISQYSYVIVFAVIFIIYAITSQGGLTWSGVMNIFRHSTVIGIIGIGMGLVCLTGEIDLSVGSMLAMVSGFSVMVFNMTNNIILTLLFAIVFGAVLGLLNGVLVGAVKMPAFIVTLATMLIFRSFTQYLCQHVDKELIGGGSSVYKMSTDLSTYQSFYQFGNGKIATVPIVGLILVAITVLFVFISTSTKYGKQVYAIGSNEKAASLAGINVPLVKVSVFVITGIMVGIGSFLWIAMNGSSDPATTGTSYEMYAIAAVVLGGIAMSGGKGKILGVFFGALSYTVIDKIIVALKMDSLINDTIKGIILIIVILIQVAGPQIKEKLQQRKIQKEYKSEN